MQKGLIDHVITVLGLDGERSNGIKMPVPDRTPLPQDKGSKPNDLGFNYASVVGMVIYLCNNSRPDRFSLCCSSMCKAQLQPNLEARRESGAYW